MEKIINGKTGLICAFCGATKTEVSFIIGASTKPDWCMIFGTGKMACPACYEKAMAEGKAAVDDHIRAHNDRVAHIPGSTVPKVYSYDDQTPESWKEFIRLLDNCEIVQIDESMFYYWLEVLPPVYMHKDQLIDGVSRFCSFGFCEGSDYVIDFWHTKTATGEHLRYCKKSNRYHRGY